MSPGDPTSRIHCTGYVQIPAVPDEAFDPEGMRRLLGPCQANDPVGQIGTRWRDLRSPKADSLPNLQT
jgi:hypothetical protein